MVRTIVKTACLMVFALLCAGSAHAQAGPCKDPWINQAFTASFHRAPQGAGLTGECNINLYGGGSWSSYQDLDARVVASKYCTDPWIGQIYKNLYNRQPSAAECTVSNYGGGSWTTYMDLTAKVQAYQQGGSRSAVVKAPTPQDLLVNANLDLVDSNGNVVAKNGTYIVASGAGNIVASGAGNIVASGAGNIVASGAGNLRPGDVIQGGAASLAGYSVQSVGGKRTIKGTVVHH